MFEGCSSSYIKPKCVLTLCWDEAALYLAQSMLCTAKGGGGFWVRAARPEGSVDVELTLSNADCEVLGSMTVSWAPTQLCVTDTHVVAASKGSILVWEISTGASPHLCFLGSQNAARFMVVLQTGCMEMMSSSTD